VLDVTVDLIRRKFRSPKRLTITVPYVLHELLVKRAQKDGRSVSNLCALLLELAFTDPTLNPTINPITKRYQQ
jgi:hypothetical protein